MRAVTLNAFSAGMTRLRTKGGASPETLYELTNGYITASRTIKERPAATYAFTVPTSSKGLCQFGGVFYTFSASAVSPVAGSTNKVLIHPTAGSTATISKIHFAHPFMGYLYVVAEFSDGGVYHYWLSDPPAWTPLTLYKENELVQPTVPNGLYYRATLINPPVAWQAETSYATGDTVQPTVPNGFKYSATICLPSSPTTSSDTEPTWPAEEFATVYESSAGNQPPAPEPPASPPSTPPGRGDGGRYTNLGGSGGRGQFGNTPIRVP